MSRHPYTTTRYKPLHMGSFTGEFFPKRATNPDDPMMFNSLPRDCDSRKVELSRAMNASGRKCIVGLSGEDMLSGPPVRHSCGTSEYLFGFILF